MHGSYMEDMSLNLYNIIVELGIKGLLLKNFVITFTFINISYKNKLFKTKIAKKNLLKMKIVRSITESKFSTF